MSKRNSPPLVIDSQNRVRELSPARGIWSEDELQRFLYDHPGALPVREVEPFFAPLIPVARELRLPSGRLDLLYTNPNGLLTLVECKLWKNEESRRSVIGQILEYANDMSRLGFTELQDAVRASLNEPAFDLVAHAAGHSEDLDEVGFVDDINRNLRRGRFLLLVVGDGIRERMEGIAAYLQAHAYLNFTFSLVELGLYDLPGTGLLVQPSVLLKTLEVERAVVRLEQERLTAYAPAIAVTDSTISNTPRRRTVSLQVYLEQLAETDPETARALEVFIERATDMGLGLDYGSGTVMLRYDPDNLAINLGIFGTNGTYENKGLGDAVTPDGIPVGAQYLEGIARLVGGHVRTSSSPFHHAARNADGSRLRINQLLEHEDEVLRLMQAVMRAFEE